MSGRPARGVATQIRAGENIAPGGKLMVQAEDHARSHPPLDRHVERTSGAVSVAAGYRPRAGRNVRAETARDTVASAADDRAGRVNEMGCMTHVRSIADQ